MYEIIYKFHERDDEGNYNKQEIKEKKKTLGDAIEDIPLEKLASVIMGQLARRDIWITDVEIFEYKKQKISFRETKGGIVIKNRKFSLDGSVITIQEVVDDPKIIETKSSTSLVPVISPPPAITPSIQNRKPIRWVILDPDERNMKRVKGTGLAFTPDKRYPVYFEVPHPTKLGVSIYTLTDDNKKELRVPDDYFLNADHVFVRGFANSIDNGNSKLSYEGVVAEPEMPDIREENKKII